MGAADGAGALAAWAGFTLPFAIAMIADGVAGVACLALAP
ncbi:chromate transporter, partial [Burkholderia pseudomallei]|nr:chromate transporter [Burkholderia pseudomallei]